MLLRMYLCAKRYILQGGYLLCLLCSSGLYYCRDIIFVFYIFWPLHFRLILEIQILPQVDF